MSTQEEQTPKATRGVPVELDRVRHLRFTLATMRKMRDKYGQEKLEKGLIGAEEVGEMLLMGLQHEDPELTLEVLEEMIDMENLPTVMEAVTRALGQGKVTPAATEIPQVVG